MKFMNIVFLILLFSCALDPNPHEKLITPIPYDPTEDVYIDNYNLDLSDDGPAGGKVCYINPNADEDGWKYIEVNDTDVPIGVNNRYCWGNMNELIGDTTRDIGSGYNNTQLMIERMLLTPVNAASYCNDYEKEIDGVLYDDWFLPSMNELKMFLEQNPDLNIEFGYYWTSSEWDQYTAIAILPDVVSVVTLGKSADCYIRPFRRF